MHIPGLDRPIFGHLGLDTLLPVKDTLNAMDSQNSEMGYFLLELFLKTGLLQGLEGV